MKSLRSLATWYFSRSALPYWAILVLDSVFTIVGFLLVYLFSHGSAQIGEAPGRLAVTLAVFLCCYMIGFRAFHTYSGVLRYSSFPDLQRVSGAVILGVALCCAVIWISSGAGRFTYFSCPDIVYAGLITLF